MMRKTILAIIPLLLIPLFVLSSDAQIETEIPSDLDVYNTNSTGTIPIWVKGIADWWVKDLIPDGEMIAALEYLIGHEIIQIDNLQLTPSTPQIPVLSEIELAANEESAKLRAQIHEYEKTNLELELRLEHFPDEQTEQWYDDQIQNLTLKWEQERVLRSQLQIDYDQLEDQKNGFEQQATTRLDKIYELIAKIDELEKQIN